MKGQKDSELARFKTKIHHTSTGPCVSIKGKYGTEWKPVSAKEAKAFEKKR